MELEQRVQALEQEIEILKNQIQVTLLEIQEQVLNNTYPELRESTPRPAPAPQRAVLMPEPEVEYEPEPVYQTRSVSTVEPGFEPPANGHAQNGNHTIKVRQVETVGEAPPPRRRAAAPQMPPPSPQAVEETDWVNRVRLEEWTRAKLEKLGPKNTRKLLRQHVNEGRITAEVAQSLEPVIELYEASGSGKDKKGVKPQRQPEIPQEPDTTVTQNSAEDDSQQNLVLRLIAGINNAGAGVKWNRKHG